MIVSERMTAYINSMDTGNPAYLEGLERKAREEERIKVLQAVKAYFG